MAKTLKKGDRVRVVNDKITPSYVGREGVITDFRYGKWTVRLEFGALRPEMRYRHHELELVDG